MSKVLGGLCLGIQPGNVSDLCLPVLFCLSPCPTAASWTLNKKGLSYVEDLYSKQYLAVILHKGDERGHTANTNVFSLVEVLQVRL